MKKRILSIILAVSMIFGIAAALSVSVSAEETLTSGDYEYAVLDDGTIKITKYTGSAENLNIPSEIDGKNVTVIGHSAFENCESLKSVTIPEGTLCVEYYAFYNCTSLSSVAIPASVNDISFNSFSNCAQLKAINVAEKSESFCSDNGALYNIDKKTLILYPAGKTDKKFTLPKSVTRITTYTFKDCVMLEAIDVAAGNNSYSSNDGVLFNKDKTLLVKYPLGKAKKDNGKYVIPNGVGGIEENAFYNCADLTDLKFSSDVASIGEYAFNGCTGLTSITTSPNTKSIAQGAFWGCTGLTSATISKGAEIIGSFAFSCCSSLEKLTIGSSVTTIDNRAFYSCTSLTSVIIPDSVVKIGEGAFYNCSLMKNLTIGSGVTSIGDKAFCACHALDSVTIPSNVTEIGSAAFGYGFNEYTFEAIKSPEFHINCYKDTAGEKYAIDNGFEYTLLGVIDVDPGAPGDANGDGKVTAADVLLIRKSIAGQSVKLDKTAADVNCDDKLTASDVLLIRKFIAGQKVQLGK